MELEVLARFHVSVVLLVDKCLLLHRFLDTKGSLGQDTQETLKRALDFFPKKESQLRYISTLWEDVHCLQAARWLNAGKACSSYKE